LGEARAKAQIAFGNDKDESDDSKKSFGNAVPVW
jgi:hypothetical protein